MSDLRFDESRLTRWSSIQAWRDDSSALVEQLLDRWDLTVEREFSGGVAGRALAVRTPDGPAVLKVGFPHPEAIAEAVALDVWSPAVAPQVRAVDASAWAMLIDRVSPGTPLSAGAYAPDRSVELACETLAVAHRVPAPPAVPALRDVIGSWPENARRMIGARPTRERQRILPWLALADRLIAEDRGDALLHGDANPGNVLEGTRGLVLIDPKPMRGRAEFDPAPLVEQVAVVTAESLERRISIAVDALGGDRELTVAWGVVRAALNVAWAWDDGNSGTPELALLDAWEALSAA